LAEWDTTSEQYYPEIADFEGESDHQ